MTIDVSGAIKDLISDIFTDREVAQEYASDPSGVLAARGLTDADLSEVDVPEAAASVAAQHGQKDPYAAGPDYDATPVTPPTYDGEQGVGEIIQHLNYVTYVTYSDDRDITQNIDIDASTDNSVDNSVDVAVDGDVDGYLDVDSAPTTVGRDVNVEQHKYDDNYGGGAKPDHEQPYDYDADYPKPADYVPHQPTGDAPTYDTPDQPYQQPGYPEHAEPPAYPGHDDEPGHEHHAGDHSEDGSVGVS
ncbi:hypothetical protein [Actinoplanes awajinensis]|uniref:Uncharacterized protein n=1 Tax=Actinoplanes awajinensis subsp. mycoplanecinus TaxID=135947 RepID=A0A124G912_9ACTN|nr:hypothetical protein [Actinoplanes awajinensis]KUL27532.1 hypothetical protein ADL15_35125 [Actinoplanes awajinensis subsp. mycoplanecinus]